jgi:hypothetical protein
MDLGTGIAVAGISITLLGGFKIAWPTSRGKKETTTTVTTTTPGLTFCADHAGFRAGFIEVGKELRTVKGILLLLARANPAINDSTLKDLAG